MIRAIKGIKDILPDQLPRWNVVEGVAHRLARCYGFREIRIPIFEITELYIQSIGGTTDIVEKEMYTFNDRDGTSLTLRPEGTAGVVRAIIEHGLANSPATRKLYYIGPMFRHERPQAGRFRQFNQFGVEFIGSTSPKADVEVISLLWRFFSTLSLPSMTLEINSLGQPPERQRYKAVLLTYLQGKTDRLCGNCQRRMEFNPLRVLDCKVMECRAVTESAPSLIDYLSTSAQHFKDVRAGLEDLGIPYSLNSRLVRGLDYYSMTTFEVTSSSLGAQNAIGAGGRYDGLFEVLGGKSTPALGFAVGLERVISILPESAMPPPSPLVFIAGFGNRGLPASFRLLEALRSKGVTAETDHYGSSLKNLLRSADRLGASFTIILGDEECMQGQVLLRNMYTKEQETIPLNSAPDVLANRLKNQNSP